MTESDTHESTERAGGEESDPLWSDLGFERELVSWRRVVIGFTVMTALHALLAFGVFAVSLTQQSFVKISLGLLPYLAGGLVLGIIGRREERSLLDPFYASVVPALFFPFVIELMRVYSTNPPQVAQAMARVQWLGVLAPVMVYVLVALFGCWFGERLAFRSDRRG